MSFYISAFLQIYCHFLPPTDAAEREQRLLAGYAEPRGGKATPVVD